MKPARLSMQAFGSYADKQELDFQELKGRSFFLIHGPTGSGKTTILDAMCYALYGDTSGAVRDGKAMRSDHAAEDVLTQVSFEFTIGSVCYRVERRPEQERPKKTGQGKTKVKPEATLWRLESEEEAVLATGWEAVTRYIETLLGFKSSQFRQVVLLPQGDFRRLLTANSAERQEIMQTLFKTELFEVIEAKLKTKAQELNRQFETLQQETAWVLKQAAVDSGDALSERLAVDREGVTRLAEIFGQAERNYQQAQAQLAAGQVLQAKFAELAAAGQALSDMEKQIPDMAASRSELARGMQAAALTDAERAVTTLEHDVEQGRVEVLNRERQLAVAARDQAETQARLSAQISLESEREALLHRIQYLSELENKVAELQQAESAVDQARQQAEQAAGKKGKTAQMLKTAQEEYTQKHQQYQQSLQLAAEADGRRLIVEEAERQITRRKLLDAARKELDEAQKRANLLAERLRRDDADILTARQQLAELQEAWEKGQAAVLAAQLQPGSACPVCGSVHHPAKAKRNSNLPDAQEIKDKQSKLQQAEADRETLRQQSAKAAGGQSLLEVRVSDLEQELQTAAHVALPELNAMLQQARERYQQAVMAKRESQSLAERLEQLTEFQHKAAEASEQLESDHRASVGRLKAAEALSAERQAGVPAEFRDIELLKQAQLAAANQYKQLKTAYELVQKQAEQANQAVVQQETALRAAKSRLESLAVRLSNEQQSFAERVIAARFTSLEDYRNAKRLPKYLSDLEQKLTRFDQQLAAAKERSNRARTAVEQLTPPDMSCLKQAIETAKAAYDTALAEHTNLTARIQQTEIWLRRLQELQQSLAQLEARYLVIGRLFEVANGRNAFGLTFQRFVLGALLDDVAIAANQRLKTMSRGRYQLQRTMDRARRNSPGGLDLEVFDNYTGVARPVTTLSGGETFIASLSLALGLADVVQSYAGGIHLDAIFIDEGFGTLDPETLEFALQALIALQQGGRLVGIISHVPELKDRIDARLEVMVSAKGSTAAFKVS